MQNTKKQPSQKGEMLHRDDGNMLTFSTPCEYEKLMLKEKKYTRTIKGLMLSIGVVVIVGLLLYMHIIKPNELYASLCVVVAGALAYGLALAMSIRDDTKHQIAKRIKLLNGDYSENDERFTR